MSVQAMTWVLEFSESRLGARHVLISIANHADSSGRNAYPSVRTIARESRLSEREVQYAIPELVKLGELHVDRGAGPGGTNKYSMPKMPKTRGAKISLAEGAKSSPGGCNLQHEGVQTGVQCRARNKEEQKQPSLEPKTGEICATCGNSGRKSNGSWCECETAHKIWRLQNPDPGRVRKKRIPVSVTKIAVSESYLVPVSQDGIGCGSAPT